MINPIIKALCNNERRNFKKLEQTANKNCGPYDDIAIISDISYMNYNRCSHTMDLYYAISHKAGMPILISLHGGGLISGSKEFNRPFCCELARAGFLVFAIEYPKVPETHINTILHDVLIAERKAIEIGEIYKADTNNVCIVGDSGGAFLALYTTCMINNTEIAEEFQISKNEVPDFNIAALCLISGLIYTTGKDMYGTFYKNLLYKTGLFKYSIPKYADPEHIDMISALPPCFLITSEGDFLRQHSIRFSKALYLYGVPHQLIDVPGKELEHDFVLMDTGSEEAKDMISEMVGMFMGWIRENRLRDEKYQLVEWRVVV